MTKCTDCLIFCATSNALKNTPIFYVCLILFSLFSILVPQMSLKTYFTTYTLLYDHSAPILPVIHTVHITFYISFNPILYSNERRGA